MEAPIEAWHGSLMPPEAFRPFAHFGTRQAALDRLVIQGLREIHRPRLDRARAAPGLVRVHLNMSNPLRIEDHGDEHVGMWGLSAAAAKTGLSGITANTPLERLAQTLTSAGFDGLIYTNCMEDRGSETWVPINPDQINRVDVEPFKNILPQILHQLDRVRLPGLHEFVNRIWPGCRAEVLQTYGDVLESLHANEAGTGESFIDWVQQEWLPTAYFDAVDKIRQSAMEPGYPPRLRRGYDWVATLPVLLVPTEEPTLGLAVKLPITKAVAAPTMGM